MDNNLNNPTPAAPEPISATDTMADAISKAAAEFSSSSPLEETVKADNSFDYQPPKTEMPQPAFDYQAPSVEVPQPPTVSQTPSAPTYQQPSQGYAQPNPYQQAAQMGYAQQPYQQPTQTGYPQQNPYQQPTQTGYAGQPYQQPTQTGYAGQPYQQPTQMGYPQQNPYQQNTAGYYQYTPTNPAMVNPQGETDGYAIASLILSICGFIACCTFVPSILGIVFGVVSKTKNDGTRPTGVSTAGIVCGIIGLLWNCLMTYAMFSN